MQTEALRTLRRLCPTISVGMLTADLMNLERELSIIQDEGVKLLHIDVMDGCFCPVMTVGPPFIKGIRTSMMKDVHLMVDEPVGKVPEYVAAGADIVTVHAESTHHVHRAVQQLSNLKNANDPERGLVRGVALNPGTPLDALEPLLSEIDMVVLLAINPGWSGQKLTAWFCDRVVKAKRMLEEADRSEVLVTIDGGVTRDNIRMVSGLGADIIVTGSAVFDGKDVAENARFMLDAVRQG
ncbi:MAG: ribulose-phosphate 3-epimerase [Acidobacteria bacterium]|nr:MAG: ribulose-phosphate 3-epimerase [Acidobacteriota bacterium]